MICFHSLNYWYLQQLTTNVDGANSSCDLLSFFELLIFTTTPLIFASTATLLWFAFILWTTDIYNNRMQVVNSNDAVVICFHSLNYWYLQQQSLSSVGIAVCCDLLSFFELLIFTTTALTFLPEHPALWFAFILWTTDIYNNNSFKAIPFDALWFAFILWTTDIYNNVPWFKVLSISSLN